MTKLASMKQDSSLYFNDCFVIAHAVVIVLVYVLYRTGHSFNLHLCFLIWKMGIIVTAYEFVERIESIL